MKGDYLEKAALVPHSTYVREIRPFLPAAAFEPARSRLVLVPPHLTLIANASFAIASGWVPWLLVPLLSAVIGVSFACLAFIAHEALHGGMARGRTTRQVIGWIGFLPFTLSPRLWSAWHDRVHHANANVAEDPDMYPTLAEYRASGRIRFLVDAFSLGGRRWRGVLSIILGFTVQSAHQLFAAKRRGFLKPRALRIAITQTLWNTTCSPR